MTPQWINAKRMAKLAELCERDELLCLKEHRSCLDKSHYQWVKPHQEVVAVPKRGPVLDKVTGLPRRDKTIPTWKLEQQTVWEWEPVHNLAEAVAEEVIASWKADDREERSLEWKREQQSIIDGTYGRFGARFDPVARDQFMAQRPEFYLTAQGVDGVHFTPVAILRVPSQNIYLFIDVSAAFVKTTKSQRRHARRHGKPVQQEVTVEDLCKEAIRLWWAKAS